MKKTKKKQNDQNAHFQLINHIQTQIDGKERL